ncbi:MAG: DegT/DnrJ/EryC1/StrS family aminotransferase [Candidatus Rokubacteria bacterium]|nr:DegT/DnrJ/EryC1/StrS family aminotransferase [Candidatus Rokubacteria bacterium]
MLLGRSAEEIARVRALATQPREPAPHYEHTAIGHNYRLSNIAAAIGRSQLTVLDDRVARRGAIFDHYVKRLGALPALAFMPDPPWA